MIYLIAFLIGAIWLVKDYKVSEFALFVTKQPVPIIKLVLAFLLLVFKLWLPLLILMLYWLCITVIAYDTTAE